MEVKQKYIDRIVMVVENEVDSIFSFIDSPDFDYEREMIINNHITSILDDIGDLVKDGYNDE